MQQQFSQNSFCMGYIGILAIRPYLPDVLRLCEVTENDGEANEAVLERGMTALNDWYKKIIENQENSWKIDKNRKS